jgi:hypothetical protein
MATVGIVPRSVDQVNGIPDKDFNSPIDYHNAGCCWPKKKKEERRKKKKEEKIN